MRLEGKFTLRFGEGAANLQGADLITWKVVQIPGVPFEANRALGGTGFRQLDH